MNLLDDTNQNDQVQIDPNIDPWEALTAPGAKFDKTKYANEDDLKRAIAKGKMEGDQYIDHFKQRHDELREYAKQLKSEYEAGPSLQELIDQIKNSKTSNNDNTQRVNEDKSDTLNMEEYQKLVRNEIAANKQLDREESNYATVQAKLIEAYGPNYVQTLKTQVSQLGLSADFVNDLARKHPQVLFKTLGLDGERKGENFQAPFKSTNRADPFNSGVPKRTWSYYEKMRKAEPLKYFDPKTQDQMFKDADSLGDNFNDGDFQKRFG